AVIVRKLDSSTLSLAILDLDRGKVDHTEGKQVGPQQEHISINLLRPPFCPSEEITMRLPDDVQGLGNCEATSFFNYLIEN
ncbi:hypothetical protein NC652_039944, partial [Populus alba x Populus x berolinensis]